MLAFLKNIETNLNFKIKKKLYVKYLYVKIYLVICMSIYVNLTLDIVYNN